MGNLLNQNLGVCVIGAGDISNYYLRAWQKQRGIDLVSIADLNEERAKKSANEYGVSSWYTDYKKAVNADKVDIVTVCIPTYLHPEVSIFAASQEKQVLCVKPISLSLEDADKMIETAQRNRVKFCVGFMRRFSGGTDAVRPLLSEGIIGKPLLYKVDIYNCIRPKRYMHDPHNCGGPVIDMCCHYFDIWRVFFNSEPTTVMAQGLIFAKGKKELDHIKKLAIDTASIIATFASGDIGIINISWGLPDGCSGKNKEEIWGPEGLITGLDYSPKEFCILGAGYEKKMFIKNKNKSQDSFDGLVDSFVKSIRSNQPLAVTGEDGKKALKISLAALKSIKTGRAVNMQNYGK